MQVINDKVSILLPIYNMASNIEGHVQTLIKSISTFISDYEIILSNDGSADNTIEVLRRIENQYANIIVVHTEINQGKGHALKRAFEYSSGRYIVFCDADMELPPSQLTTYFDIMEREQVDIVIGSKRHPESKLHYSFIRRTISLIYFMFVKVVFGLPIRDTQTGLKLFKREALEGVFPRILVKAFAYDLEVLVAAYKNGFSIAESPIILEAHRHNGLIPVRVLYRTFIDTLAIFYRLHFLKFYENLLGNKKNNPLVSIIIPLKKINDYIVECSTWILKQTYQNFELIILPDEYNESTEYKAIFEDSRITISKTGNKSPAIKRHMGTTIAKGEIFAFIDDDTYPEVNWLENAIRVLDNNDVRVVGGVAVTAENDSYSEHISGMIYSNFMTSAKHTLRYEPKKVQYVHDYPSCNLIITREIYTKSGGFNSNFYPGEDTVLCNNIIKLGEKILYSPDVLVYHHRRKLLFGHFKQVSGYGWHRGYFVKMIGGNSLRLSYFIPSLFLLYIVLLIASPLYYPHIINIIASHYDLSNNILNVIKILPFAPLILYNILLLVSWVGTLAPIKGFVMCLGIFTTHIVYGFNFIKGILSKKI